MGDLMETIRGLAASTIPVGLQARSDAGVLVWLGDDINGIDAQRGFRFDELDAAAQWLCEAACVCYPHSYYAQHITEWHLPPMHPA